MTDLLLINPGGRKKIYQQLAAGLTAIEPPVWAALMAAAVRKRGFEAVILDSNAEGWGPEETAQEALQIKAKLIGIVVYGHNPSASTQVMPAAGAVCRAIKALVPDAKVILLGGHVTALPGQTLREEPVDYVCDGEGPATLLGLLENQDLNQVPDLWRREKDDIVPPALHAPLVQNLDEEIPEIPWDLLPMEKYRAHNWHCFGDLPRMPYAAIYTTLGCPYRCEFCCIQAPFKTGERALGYKPEIASYRFWSPAWVVRQIDALVQNHNVRSIKIADEMFVLNRAHVSAICDLLIQRNYGLNIWAYARVDTAKDPALLEKLKRAGVNWLVLGIEAANDLTRKDVDKNFRQEDIFESVRNIQNAGIYVLGNYIFGLPEDSLKSMQQTLDLAVELNTEFANFYCAMAYPGSALYTRALSEKKYLSHDWGRYSQHAADTLPFPSHYLSAGEVVRFRDRAFELYFNRQEYRRMLESKCGTSALKEIQEMLSLTLKREPSLQP